MRIEITNGVETPVTKFFSSAPKTKSHVCALSLDMTGNCMICAIERERDEALMDRNNGDIATMTINHYERLIKERDEAREDAARIADILSGLELRTTGELAKLERERNEVQKELSSIHRWIERNHSDGFIDSITYLQNLERVTDSWYDRIDKIERERDEWAAMCGRYKQERDELLEKTK